MAHSLESENPRLERRNPERAGTGNSQLDLFRPGYQGRWPDRRSFEAQVASNRKRRREERRSDRRPFEAQAVTDRNPRRVGGEQGPDRRSFEAPAVTDHNPRRVGGEQRSDRSSDRRSVIWSDTRSFAARALNEQSKQNFLRKRIERKHIEKNNERATALDSIREKLDELHNDLEEARDRHGENPVFRAMDRDTERDIARESVMREDLGKSSKQRRQERKEWENKKLADDLVFNDHMQSRERFYIPWGFIPGVNYIPTGNHLFHKATGKIGSLLFNKKVTGKSLESLDNRLRHRVGHKLQEKYGSAELEKRIEKQEFRERDWKTSQLQRWADDIYRRKRALDRLRAPDRLEEGPETEYISRYQALEGGQRLDRKDREGIIEVKRALRENHDMQYTRELYSSLPYRELQRWRTRLEKEEKWRRTTRKDNRTTTFEKVDDTRLKQLIEGANEQIDVRIHASKLSKFIKDISGKTNLAVKSNDVLRQMVGRRKKNMSISKAIRMIPRHLREQVFQELSESQREYVRQALARRRRR